jgi:hypothetical protein
MQSKEDMARLLAEAHYQIEPGVTQIFRIHGTPEAEARANEPIKLLEVNESTVPSGVLPLRFGPLPEQGFHYPSIVVEITPEEFEKLQARELKLPDGWALGDLLPKPRENGDG